MADVVDFAIVGSGFGGSVAALRLADAGHEVVVLEQGGRLTPERMRAADADPRALLWMPPLGLHGYFTQHVFQHLSIAAGVGVGGGSLVYGAVLLEPDPAIFDRPPWSTLGVAWWSELAPHYATAARMLGRATNPRSGTMDRYLRAAATQLGAEAVASFGPTPNGIYFGERGVDHADPYFGGDGPPRTGCTFCGRCLTGCPHRAKNTLDLNYLHLAERRGATILPHRQVTRIERTARGYRLTVRDPRHPSFRPPPLDARRVVLAAGVVGTLTLLFRARDVDRTLPAISPRLGDHVFTNSEAIVGVLHDRAPADLTEGTAISSHFWADSRTHLTQNRFPPGYDFMRWYAAPLVDGERPLARAAASLAEIVAHPLASTRAWRRRDFHRHATVLTVMQHADNELAFRHGRHWTWPFGRRLHSRLAGGGRPPTYLAQANAAARALAAAAGGTPFNLAPESIGNQSITAHILGGCRMSLDPAHGVIAPTHEVHGCPGLYVLDGAAISGNVGVNPSLTITAMAERAAAALARQASADPAHPAL